MLWRILSVLNNLKRVGFALLVLGCTICAKAQPPDTVWTRAVTDLDLTDSMVVSQEIYALDETDVGSIVGVGFSLYDDVDTDDIDSLGGLVVKLNANGEFQWETFVRNCNYLSGVVAKSEDSILVAGYSSHVTPTFDYYQTPFVALLNALGDTIWTRSLQFDTSMGVENVRIIQVEEDEFLLSGFRQAPFSVQKQIFLVWINEAADTLRVKYFNSLDERNVLNINVQENGDGLVLTYDAGASYPFCAYFLSSAGDSLTSFVSPITPPLHTTGSPLFSSTSEIYVARNYVDSGLSKISSDGSLVWQVYYEPWRTLASPNEDGHGGLILACQSDDYTIGIVRVLSSTGQPDWENLMEPEDADAYYLHSGPLRLSDGGYLVAGTAEYDTEPLTAKFPYFVRFEAPLSSTSQFPLIPDEITLTVYPNPSNAAIDISFEMPRAAHATIKVYDVLGREQATLLDGVEQGGARRVMWNAEGFASGIYFVRLSVGDVAVTKKVALVR